MRNRSIFLSLGAAIALSVAVAIALGGSNPAPPPPAAAVEDLEHARTIEAMRPPKRARPVIAVLALNEATEVTDLLVPYGVLQRADVADVTVVAERAAPVPLHPFSALGRGPELLRIEPQSTARDFDERYPDGVDYVVVPAMEPRNNQFVMDWILAQQRKGAKIFSVCAGSLTLAAAGLLDGRRATTHWAYIRDLRKAHPTMQWVQDRRYVADNGISTSTGITASIPATVALVEAIAGRRKRSGLLKIWVWPTGTRATGPPRSSSPGNIRRRSCVTGFPSGVAKPSEFPSTRRWMKSRSHSPSMPIRARP